MEGIRFRCPGCTKLYRTDPMDLEPGRVEFLCQSCQSTFAINAPVDLSLEEVPAILIDRGSVSSISPIKKTLESYPCSQCGAQNPKGALECQSCGIVFYKLDRGKSSLAAIDGSPPLAEAWEGVLSEYENMQKHEAFIQLALREKNLPFASQQYRKIFLANPTDSIAQRMTDRIVNLAMATFVPEKTRVDSLGKKSSKLPMVLVGIGLTLALLGTLLPPLKQIVSPGVALLVLGIGSWVIRR